ncbi:selenium binding [Desmophyllum pertusum]|uniref:Selenium binding n=1 Tax=Desmophyllum pertusum TaxID=174260 RepID=A0A9W9ZHS2_9CNID|nr:selenium binding [Desmophyllum pertusum]
MKQAAASISELESRVSFPVYQEPANQDIMGMLDGKKDDMLIYDRCGLLVYHYSMPHVVGPRVWNSLGRVYNNKISKCHRHCPTTITATTTQSTTAMPVTSQEASTNPTSESVTSQPQPETTTSS